MLRPPVAPQKKRPIGLRILGCTILIWYLQMAVRAYLDQPVATALARARGDEMYDGVGGNVAVMVLGWVFGLMATVPSVAGWLLHSEELAIDTAAAVDYAWNVAYAVDLALSNTGSASPAQPLKANGLPSSSPRLPSGASATLGLPVQPPFPSAEPQRGSVHHYPEFQVPRPKVVLPHFDFQMSSRNVFP